VCDLEAFAGGIDGLREAFGRRLFRREGLHRCVQPSGGCLIAVEGFQRIANLAFHAVLLERQRDPPFFLKDLFRSAQDQRASPAVAQGPFVPRTRRREECADQLGTIFSSGS
jgi:hypothetical protein